MAVETTTSMTTAFESLRMQLVSPVESLRVQVRAVFRRRESASRHSRRSVWLRDSTGGSFDHLVPLQEEFEVDHIAPLHRGGSFDNDIYSLQAPHKRCQLPKNSLEQRRS